MLINRRAQHSIAIKSLVRNGNYQINTVNCVELFLNRTKRNKSKNHHGGLLSATSYSGFNE